MSRSYSCSIGLALVLACAPQGGRPVDAPAHSGAAATAVGAVPEPDDSSCDFVHATAHPNPDSLIVEFLRRDMHGQFLQSEKWLDSATTCPGHLPGPDFFTLVADVHLVASSRTLDTAQYLAVYRRLGWTGEDSTGSQLTVRPSPKADTLHFRLVRTGFGWRVDDPEMPQYVLAAAVRDRFPPVEQARLDSLSRLPP